MKISKLSVARWYDPFISIVSAIALFLYILPKGFNNTFSVFLIVAGVAFVQSIVELLRRKDIFKQKINKQNPWPDVRVRFLGVVLGVFFILFMIWLLPEYYLPKYLTPLSEIKYFYAALVMALSLPMIYVTNLLLGNKKDGTYEMGLFLKNPFNLYRLDLKLLRDGFLEWTLRGFFLVLNFTTAVALIAPFKTGNLFILPTDIMQATFLLLKIIFLILLFTIIPGYMFSSRLLNTQVENVDRTAFGWLVTFICYNPIVNVVFTSWLNYSFYVKAGAPWVQNLQNIPILLGFVGFVVVFMEVIHLWSEATLGIRSSNLMNRGVVTSGPFRFTKHPVYVAKCIGWFFATMPFMGMGSWLHGLQMTILFFGVCVVYTMRAWAEEKVFSDDPIYQEYAKYMDKHGIFAFVGQYIRFMSWQWRFKYWQDKQPR